MAVTNWRTVVWASIGCVAAAGALADGAGTPAPPATEAAPHSRLQDLLTRQITFVRRNTPAWIRELSSGRLDPTDPARADAPQLVLQQDRPDGTDLVTLRYPLAQGRALRAYAGAGLHRAVYFADELGAPEPLSHRDRNRSVGAAAELGAEYRAGERLLLSADLRWVELDPDAVRLASGAGVVGADELSLGVSLGWRFR